MNLAGDNAPISKALAAPDVVDLRGAATPGPSSADPEHVWYVSYGSNLLRERFEVYLLGGSFSGLAQEYPGGPDTSAASDERAVVLPGRLRFALDAPAWGGGGVAMWQPGPGPGVLARAWRVTLRQFLEFVHLENGGQDRRAAPWPAGVLSSGSARTGDGWYSRLIHPGDIRGEPALTFTNPEPELLTTRGPSPAYREVVTSGVVQTFGGDSRGGLSGADAADYVSEALGA